MNSPTSTVLLTTGEIARRVKQPLWRVEYIIKARDIRYTGKAGSARVFTEHDVEFIASELRRIDNDKEAS